MTLAQRLAISITGSACQVHRREADWSFCFGPDVSLAVSVPWRIVSDAGIVLGGEDDGHQFGLPKPLDAEALANRLLSDAKVKQLDADELTADLRIVFEGGVRLDIFNNSAGYEGWQAYLPPSEHEGNMVIGMGGGGLAPHPG